MNNGIPSNQKLKGWTINIYPVEMFAEVHPQGKAFLDTLGGKIQYFNRGGQISPKGSRSQDPVGKAERGQLMVKKLKELADEIYTFNLGNFRGGTTALKAKRAELKLGKDTFQNAKQY